MDIKDTIMKWKDILLHPSDMLSKELNRGGLRDGALHMLLGGAIGGFFIGILLALYPAAVSDYSYFSSGNTFFSLLSSIIGYAIIVLVGWFIGSGLYYIFAKILGGKGSFAQQSYLLALWYAPIVAISWIPLIGMVFAIYSLYLVTVSQRIVHKFSTLRAVLSWLLPLLIMIVLVFVALVFFFAGAASGLYGVEGLNGNLI
ncbi:MAG TPA: YIP1 family protein [archaeon]|nr:YIP1 family protein [archaeon]